MIFASPVVEVAREVAVVLLVVRRRHQHADVAPDHFRFRISEQLLGAAVERLDDALGVDDDDAVDRRVEDRIEPFGAGRSLRRGDSVGFRGRAPLMVQPRNNQPSQDKER